MRRKEEYLTINAAKLMKMEWKRTEMMKKEQNPRYRIPSLPPKEIMEAVSLNYIEYLYPS